MDFGQGTSIQYQVVDSRVKVHMGILCFKLRRKMNFGRCKAKGLICIYRCPLLLVSATQDSDEVVSRNTPLNSSISSVRAWKVRGVMTVFIS